MSLCGNNAFIILGRDNDVLGNPDRETVARLEAAITHVDQASCIVLTGHDYHNQSMRRWLSQNADLKPPVYSVIAHDTIGQAVFSAPLTHALGFRRLTIITSDYHIPRSRAIFEKVHGACCELAFIGAQHSVENLDATTQHEQASLAMFIQQFAHATNIFDWMAILFDHHPRYQRVALERADRDPDSQDSRCMWEWKNDPDLIPWDIHRVWYASAVNDANQVILMACVNGIRAGVLRFDLTAPDSAEIDINLNPSMRGKKHGKPILAAACKYGLDVLKLSCIYAEVKPGTVPSVEVFEDVGFVFQGMRGSRCENRWKPQR